MDIYIYGTIFSTSLFSASSPWHQGQATMLPCLSQVLAHRRKRWVCSSPALRDGKDSWMMEENWWICWNILKLSSNCDEKWHRCRRCRTRWVRHFSWRGLNHLHWTSGRSGGSPFCNPRNVSRKKMVRWLLVSWQMCDHHLNLLDDDMYATEHKYIAKNSKPLD